MKAQWPDAVGIRRKAAAQEHGHESAAQESRSILPSGAKAPAREANDTGQKPKDFLSVTTLRSKHFAASLRRAGSEPPAHDGRYPCRTRESYRLWPGERRISCAGSWFFRRHLV